MTQTLKQGKVYSSPHPHQLNWPLEPSLGTLEAARLQWWYISVTHTAVLYFPQVSTTEF